MCLDCHPSPPPQNASIAALWTRRSILALGAGSVGVFLGLWSCTETHPGRTGGGGLKPAPATTQALLPATTTAPALASTAPAPATVAATGPAPDLGSELFPDATGKAIAQPADAPVIVVPRSSWTRSGPNLNDIALMNGIDKITVHHTAMPMTADAWKPTAAMLEGIRGFHAGTAPGDRNWADIAYHFVVDRAGRVWQARPLAYQGAHVRGHNEHNLGIVLLGNFEDQSPSAAQLWSLAHFIGFLRPLYQIPLDRIYTHGELGQTSCPGKSLQAYMNRTRRAWATAEGARWESPKA